MDYINDHQHDATRSIRVLTILAWIPTLALGLPFSINNFSILPALGILPMTFSACVGMISLSQRRRVPHGVLVAMDIFCACFLFGVFIPSCVVLSGAGHSIASDQTTVGTLGAAPMMLNLYVAA